MQVYEKNMIAAGLIYAAVNLHDLIQNILPVVKFVLWFLNWRTFHVSDRTTINLLYANLGTCFSCESDNELRPTGVVVHHRLKYIIHRRHHDRWLSVYCSKNTFDRLTQRSGDGVCKYVHRSGESGYVQYKIRSRPVRSAVMTLSLIHI